ncbi:hypothetical protein GZH47_09175 [Paenibacillus rhizovicinus]|uniref:EfeO-type cupredoxin-like domain-containing protein n=1 Tax=Paenibacillus rhizovicinus TaxID=2704463 RepID=A0A6C0NYI9_9BACL|nr:cupredoxin domain-containing protein [Paenibacillus rhizovicinus]QHW31006.1 hypothetical protein GZH47_09175 [Paenibacillus rhizovicinus]
MFKQVLTTLLLAGLTLGMLTACSSESEPSAASGAASASETSGSQTIKLTLTEFSFSQKEITVKKGETVHFVLTNAGAYPHDINSEELALDKDVDPGQTAEFDWTAPDKAGTYQVICDKPGHMDKGMTMSLIVNG